MRNIYDVIRDKEAEIDQLQKQVEALRLAARILSEDSKPEQTARETSRPAVRNSVAPPITNDTEIVIGAPLRQFP